MDPSPGTAQLEDRTGYLDIIELHLFECNIGPRRRFLERAGYLEVCAYGSVYRLFLRKQIFYVCGNIGNRNIQFNVF